MSLEWGKNKTSESSNEVSRPDKIREMAGHSGDINAAIDAAPESTDIPIPSSVASVPRKRGRPQQVQPITQPIQPVISAEEQRRLQQVEAAKKKIQSYMAGDIAGLPYDIWSFVSSDDSKSLTKDEERELSEAYALVAESLDITSSPLWTGILFILSRNARLIKSRIKSLKELEDAAKLIKDAKK